MDKSEKLKEINKIKSDLMYDFPNNYSNSRIVAYQMGLEKLVKAILKNKRLFD